MSEGLSEEMLIKHGKGLLEEMLISHVILLPLSQDMHNGETVELAVCFA